VCKKDIQKLLGKINYLRHFISNLARRVESFERIKKYLMSPPVLRAPKTRNLFKMYIGVQEWVIGPVLVQQEDGKECSVAYVSQCLLDAETWYVFMEKLCLSL
jgi:hypothetical protein